MTRAWALAAAGGVALLALGSVLAVSFVSMRERSRDEECRGRLLLVHLAVRAGDLPDAPGWDAAGTGRAFLAVRDRWPVRQRREIDLGCPVKGTRGDVDYRGPATSIRRLGATDPLAADRIGNHGPGKGGNVLLKNGSVFGTAETDAAWRRASETTSD